LQPEDVCFCESWLLLMNNCTGTWNKQIWLDKSFFLEIRCLYSFQGFGLSQGLCLIKRVL
jgi:hypothetical protein